MTKDEQEARKNMAHQIKECMSHVSMSRTELAIQLKVSPAYITKMLRGEQNFTIGTLWKISEVFHKQLRVEIL